MQNKIRYPIAFVLAIFLNGCSTEQTVTPDYLFNDASKSIRLTLNDDRVVRISQGDYTVSKQADSSFLKGIGIQYSAKNDEKRNFKGTINFSEIKQLQLIEIPTNWVTIPAIVVVSLVVTFFIVVSTVTFGG